MTDADRIKEIGQRAGALVVGVAAADAFNDFVPEYAAQSQGQCYECMRVCPVGRAYRTKK